jgi:hypothetical protein
VNEGEGGRGGSMMEEKDREERGGEGEKVAYRANSLSVKVNRKKEKEKNTQGLVASTRVTLYEKDKN